MLPGLVSVDALPVSHPQQLLPSLSISGSRKAWPVGILSVLDPAGSQPCLRRPKDKTAAWLSQHKETAVWKYTARWSPAVAREWCRDPGWDLSNPPSVDPSLNGESPGRAPGRPSTYPLRLQRTEERPMRRLAMEIELAAFLRRNSTVCARPACSLKKSFLVYCKTPGRHPKE